MQVTSLSKNSQLKKISLQDNGALSDGKNTEVFKVIKQ